MEVLVLEGARREMFTVMGSGFVSVWRLKS